MPELRSPDRVWWTPDQLAEAALPDLPQTGRRINAMAARFNWRAVTGKARRRKGKGGGWEYHWTLLPMRAQQALLATVKQDGAPQQMPRGEAWEWFEGLPEKHQAKARQRLAMIQRVEALVAGGLGRDLAVREVAQIEGVSGKTIWNYMADIAGVRIDDRLPYLAPRYQAAMRRVQRAEVDDAFWEFLKSDYLRPEAPSFASCYRRAVQVARDQGWQTGKERTMRNRLSAEVPELTQTLCRKGVDALKALYPAQTRDRVSLHAMEAVNADYHRFDVFVRWPVDPGSNSGGGQIVRPQLVAFQDIYSGRILSWRLDRTPNKVGVSLALGDMIERFGIPSHGVLDNGREFANKFLTGGVKTR
ncbi:DNA-binding domain-containing protein, partial [Leisingera sp.]